MKVADRRENGVYISVKRLNKFCSRRHQFDTNPVSLFSRMVLINQDRNNVSLSCEEQPLLNVLQRNLYFAPFQKHHGSCDPPSKPSIVPASRDSTTHRRPGEGFPEQDDLPGFLRSGRERDFLPHDRVALVV